MSWFRVASLVKIAASRLWKKGAVMVSAAEQSPVLIGATKADPSLRSAESRRGTRLESTTLSKARRVEFLPIMGSQKGCECSGAHRQCPGDGLSVSPQAAKDSGFPVLDFASQYVGRQRWGAGNLSGRFTPGAQHGPIARKELLPDEIARCPRR